MFGIVGAGIKAIKGVKIARKTMRDVPEAKQATANLISQVSVAVQDRKLSDQEIDQIGDSFKTFLRESRDVVQAYWPLIKWLWNKIR